MKNKKTIIGILVALVIILVALLVMAERAHTSEETLMNNQVSGDMLPAGNPPSDAATSKVTPKPVSSVLSVVKELFKTYKNGSISSCIYNGSTVYVGALNANDAGSTVYDSKGKVIDTVSGMIGKSQNGIAEKLNPCIDIYVVTPNIWGKAGVNKYNL
jgi:hypothetical protein